MFQEHSRNFGYFYLVKIKLVLNAKKKISFFKQHKHVNFFEFACTVCSKMLPSNERLRLHMRQHTGNTCFVFVLRDLLTKVQHNNNNNS